MKVNKILKKLNNSCSNEPLEDDDKEIGYFRELNRGKSFDFSEWKPLTKYTNDVFKQDFVSYENVLLVCKETHISENPPVLEYDSDGNPIGVLSKEWYWAFSASALLTGLKIKVDDDLSVESINPVQNKVITDAFSNINTTLTSELNKKVDKVYGKGLSAEDFTTTLKRKLESLENYNDTSLKSDVETLQKR